MEGGESRGGKVQRTIVRGRATKYLFASLEGQHVRIAYYKDHKKALVNLFRLHCFDGTVTVDDIVRAARHDSNVDLPFAKITYLRKHRGIIAKESEVTKEGAELGAIVVMKMDKGEHVIVKEIKALNKCEHCGAHFVEKHLCNHLRSQYYLSLIHI